MINLTFKQLLWLLIVVVFTTVLAFFSFKFLIELSISDRYWMSSLLGLLGNILGGLIGGIVAYIVASYQVSHARDAEKVKHNQTTSTMLKLIREELKDNVGFLDSSDISVEKEFTLLKTQLSDDTWKSTMFNLHISDDLIVKLNVCYRKILLIKSLDLDEVDQDFLTEIKQQIETTVTSIGEHIPKDA